MKAHINWLNQLVNNNISDFSSHKGINWLNPYNSYKFQLQRDQLLQNISNNMLFNETKPYHKQISKGCEICGQGKWSCLFITNKCNAGCFYCPAPQDQDEKPSTQGIDFTDPVIYANYVKQFNFKGVSFSGGEPFLFFDRTLEYLKKVREICDPDVYIWMYTNGILVTEEKLKALGDAGLNEIRFDIGATSFCLHRVEYAKGIIPNVTIEIPAIPEAKELLKKLLPKMIDAGVTNLNLHQLRLTNHNARNLIRRGYTILHAEKPLVLESELTALEIINYAKEHNFDIGINYCSFFYKSRFQKAGFRKQVAQTIGIDMEKISENGFIRNFEKNSISYSTIRISDKKNHANEKIIDIDGHQFYFKEEAVFCEKNLSADICMKLDALLNNEPGQMPEDPLLFKVWQHEYMEKGLREY